MEQNDSKNRTDFFTEIGIALRRDGYDTSVPDNGLLPVLVDRLPLCRISETGSVRYRDADIGSAERENALHEVTQTAETVAEYMKLIKHRISGISAAICGLEKSLNHFDTTQTRLPLNGGDEL